MVASITRKVRGNRAAAPHVLGALVQYSQIRYMYERRAMWDVAR